MKIDKLYNPLLVVTSLIVSFVLLHSPVKADTMVETFSHWDGGSSFTFGGVNAGSPRRAGQTFMVPTDNEVLNEFSFWVDDNLDPDAIPLKGYVYLFDDITSHAVGPSLFESLVQTTTNNGGAEGFEKVTFSTGGVTLDEDKQYIAFIESQLPVVPVLNKSSLQVAGALGNPYPDGMLRGALSQVSPTVAAWSGFESIDLAFEFKFAPSSTEVPEPATLLLFGVGIGIGSLFRYQSKRRSSIENK